MTCGRKVQAFFVDVCVRCLRPDEEAGELAMAVAEGEGELKEVEDEVVTETGRLESCVVSGDTGCLD